MISVEEQALLEEKFAKYVDAFIKKYNVNRDVYKVETRVTTYKKEADVDIDALAWTIEVASTSNTVNVFGNLPIAASGTRTFYNILGLDYEQSVKFTGTPDLLYYIIQHKLVRKS